MEDYTIEVRRTRFYKNRMPTGSVSLRIRFDTGHVVLSRALVKIMKLKEGSAIMFAFSKKESTAYIYEERPEPDSYFLSRNAGQLRFMSKELTEYFREFFKLPEGDSVPFMVDASPDEKGRRKITPVLWDN